MPDVIDLLHICLDSDKFYCLINLDNQAWLKLGRVKLAQHQSYWALSAYLGQGATDSDESTAFACRVGLVDLQMKFCTGNHFFFEAWFHPDPEEFRVPSAGYDPFKDPTTVMCSSPHCKPHPIVRNYVPNKNPELFETVRKYQTQIRIGPVESP